MGACVDYEYYSTVYMGTEADEASFPALCARAADVVGAMTRWKDPETMTVFQKALYKKAVCAQIDFFGVNGLESVSIYGGDSSGFTVGKVKVSGGSKTTLKTGGSMANSIAPMAALYLEQTGLLNPNVAVAPDMPMIGGGL